MLVVLLLAAEAGEVSPRTLVLIGTLCLLVAAYFCVATVNNRLRALVRWGEDGGGPAMSALGAATGAIDAFLFAVLSFANALQWKTLGSITFWVLLIAIFGTTFVALRDHARSRKRI